MRRCPAASAHVRLRGTIPALALTPLRPARGVRRRTSRTDGRVREPHVIDRLDRKHREREVHGGAARSEERRVGKERRCECARAYGKKDGGRGGGDGERE